MSVQTHWTEKRVLVTQVFNKLSIDTGKKAKDFINTLDSKSDIDSQYTVAMRYARKHVWGYNSNDPKAYREQWLKEIRKLKTDLRDADLLSWKSVEDTEKPLIYDQLIHSLGLGVKSFGKRDSQQELTEAEASVPAVPKVELVPPIQSIKPEYQYILDWLQAVDSNQLNGTVKQADNFISLLDGYTYKIQTLLVNQAKQKLKTLLQQVKECETVLDKSEVEAIWLEVGETTIPSFSGTTAVESVTTNAVIA